MRPEKTFVIFVAGLAVMCGILLLAGRFLDLSPVLLGIVVMLLAGADILFVLVVRQRR